MSGILHLPQGGAQIAVISQIPEVFLDRDVTYQEMLDTLGEYTYVIQNDNSYMLVKSIWDDIYSSEAYSWLLQDPVSNGDQMVVNAAKHSGFNFQPSAIKQNTQEVLITVKAMFIDRVVDFASERIMCFAKVSESSWSSTNVKIHLIPYNKDAAVSDYINLLLNHIDGAENGVYTMQFIHNGVQDQNDIEGLMLGELPAPGKYLVGITTSSNVTQAYPTLYNLQFRTY